MKNFYKRLIKVEFKPLAEPFQRKIQLCINESIEILKPKSCFKELNDENANNTTDPNINSANIKSFIKTKKFAAPKIKSTASTIMDQLTINIPNLKTLIKGLKFSISQSIIIEAINDLTPIQIKTIFSKLGNFRKQMPRDQFMILLSLF